MESQEIRVSDVNWKIQLQKKPIGNDGGKMAVGVYLVSTFDEANLSCNAQATFKLLRNDNQIDQAVVKYLQKQKFTNLNHTHGFEQFVDWTDFMADFVSEGKATFHIELSAEPSQRLAQSNIEQECAKLRVSLENVSTLEESCSPEIVVRGIKWFARFFYVFLCADKLDMDKNWSYDVDCTFTLLAPRQKGEDDFIKCTSKDFNDVDDWGFKYFMKWSKFIDSYVIGNKANFIIEFKVHEPKPMWTLDKPKLSNASTSLQCAVCLECSTSGNICTIKCGHLFCQPCFTKSIEKR